MRGPSGSANQTGAARGRLWAILAIAALQVAHELNFNVPRDVSIVGFDRIAMSQLMSPPLTTVEQPMMPRGARCSSTFRRRPRSE